MMQAKQLIIMGGFMLGLTASVHARLGEVPMQVETRYGKPSFMHWNVPESQLQGKMEIEKVNHLKDAKYHANGYDITVEYDKGKSTQETFTKSNGIDEKEAETLIKANGKKWAVVTSDDRNVVKCWNCDDTTAILKKTRDSKSLADTLIFTFRAKSF